MSEPFLAEVRIIGFNFAPRGWAFCDGQILPINQNQSLFSLLGTTFGGDGRTSFALPELRGRTPIHVGSSNGSAHIWGQKSGAETVTLAAAQMPQHTHGVRASSSTTNTIQSNNNLFGGTNPNDMYLPETGAALGAFSPPIPNVGGGQSHNNMQPYIALNFTIALQGLFPSRN